MFMAERGENLGKRKYFGPTEFCSLLIARTFNIRKTDSRNVLIITF